MSIATVKQKKNNLTDHRGVHENVSVDISQSEPVTTSNTPIVAILPPIAHADAQFYPQTISAQLWNPRAKMHNKC